MHVFEIKITIKLSTYVKIHLFSNNYAERRRGVTVIYVVNLFNSKERSKKLLKICVKWMQENLNQINFVKDTLT